MDGLLVVDKPAGPTSHDVVMRIRRVLGEPRVGHTGTLDPAATGVLALVLGRATRLAQFLSDTDKSYEAVVRFGFATDTADAQGRAVGPASSAAMPSRDAIDEALDAFRGTFLQQPPAFSAKKIGGTRSHTLARRRARDAVVADAAAAAALPVPTTVTAHAIDVVRVDGDTVMLRVDCSSGFYVRSLAHDLGARLGIGAHLAALRRTRAGECTVDHAIALEAAERAPGDAIAAIVPMSAMLPRLPAFTLTADGVRRAMNGCALGERDIATDDTRIGSLQGTQSPVPGPPSPLARLLDPAGCLVGIGRHLAARGLLHPSVILG